MPAKANDYEALRSIIEKLDQGDGLTDLELYAVIPFYADLDLKLIVLDHAFTHPRSAVVLRLDALRQMIRFRVANAEEAASKEPKGPGSSPSDRFQTGR